MLGYLLAAVLTVQCTVVNFDPEPTLVCSNRKEPIPISYTDWPSEVWHGPELGFTYQLRDLGNGQFEPMPSVRDEAALAKSIRKSRNEQRRWMRESLQNPKKE